MTTQSMPTETARTKANGALTTRGAVLRVLRLVLSSVTLLLVACDECRTWADCTGDGFMACVEGQCEAVTIDEGETCELPSDCGAGSWACVDTHCALMPTCQKLVGDMAYAARCDGSPTPRKGTARASATGCVNNIAASDAFAFDIALGSIAVQNGLKVDGIDTNGRCFAASWSALDSTLHLTGCSIGASTCDLVLRAQSRPGVPCISATAGACTEGLTCTALPSLAGAGVCR
jgi:hypothetical protein